MGVINGSLMDFMYENFFLYELPSINELLTFQQTNDKADGIHDTDVALT